MRTRSVSAPARLQRDDVAHPPARATVATPAQPRARRVPPPHVASEPTRGPLSARARCAPLVIHVRPATHDQVWLVPPPKHMPDGYRVGQRVALRYNNRDARCAQVNLRVHQVPDAGNVLCVADQQLGFCSSSLLFSLTAAQNPDRLAHDMHFYSLSLDLLKPAVPEIPGR